MRVCTHARARVRVRTYERSCASTRVECDACLQIILCPTVTRRRQYVTRHKLHSMLSTSEATALIFAAPTNSRKSSSSMSNRAIKHAVVCERACMCYGIFSKAADAAGSGVSLPTDLSGPCVAQPARLVDCPASEQSQPPSKDLQD